MGGDLGAVLAAVLSPQARAPVQEAGASLGLDTDQISSAVSALLPALTAGITREEDEGTAGDLIARIRRAGETEALDDLGDPVETGNDVLGQLFGNRDVSRAVAADAAQRSGIGEEALKRLLPVVAATLVSQLADRNDGQSARSGLLGGVMSALGGGQQSGGRLGGLGSLAGSLLGGRSSSADASSDLSSDVLRMIMRR